MDTKGRGGKPSKQNTIHVCGLLVGASPSCHTFLQRNEIGVERGPAGAEGTVIFTAKTPAAAEWLRIKVGESIVSPVMAETEISL
jgi:hypothetical protein